MRCNHRDDQGCLCLLNLVNEHPLGKWKQRRSFHRNLASAFKQESKDFSWKEFYHYLFVQIFSKQTDSPNVSMNQVMWQMSFLRDHAAKRLEACFAPAFMAFFRHELRQTTPPCLIIVFTPRKLSLPYPYYAASVRSPARWHFRGSVSAGGVSVP